MSECVGAHPGADFDVCRRRPVPGSQIRGRARKRFTAQPISRPAPKPWCRREPGRANIAAIELLGRLRAVRRPATPAEQRVLAAWSGWGAVPEAFDCRDDRFTAERDRLRELLSREEYQRAEASILNAQRTQ